MAQWAKDPVLSLQWFWVAAVVRVRFLEHPHAMGVAKKYYMEIFDYVRELAFLSPKLFKGQLYKEARN